MSGLGAGFRRLLGKEEVEPQSLLGRWLVTRLVDRPEERKRYVARFGEVPDEPEQGLIVQEVFGRLLERYLALEGTSEDGLLDEYEGIGRPDVPERAVGKVAIYAALGRIPRVPPDLWLPALVAHGTLAMLMMPRLDLPYPQVVDLVREKEQELTVRGIALHPA
ncbi:hypothetical protein [Kitasatospora sp. NBC_01266]|uniref:hypothetical protein n=1 Tax=Kitasatospora sp. NBC_01266 TaxID=2903572 RepID=UPI002E329446|nr:hypothetical protein [Kitasatospora sp. NBC_01266]